MPTSKEIDKLKSYITKNMNCDNLKNVYSIFVNNIDECYFGGELDYIVIEQLKNLGILNENSLDEFNLVYIMYNETLFNGESIDDYLSYIEKEIDFNRKKLKVIYETEDLIFIEGEYEFSPSTLYIFPKYKDNKELSSKLIKMKITI